jgi:hypothetical protein
MPQRPRHSPLWEGQGHSTPPGVGVVAPGATASVE